MFSRMFSLFAVSALLVSGSGGSCFQTRVPDSMRLHSFSWHVAGQRDTKPPWSKISETTLHCDDKLPFKIVLAGFSLDNMD